MEMLKKFKMFVYKELESLASVARYQVSWWNGLVWGMAAGRASTSYICTGLKSIGGKRTGYI